MCQRVQYDVVDWLGNSWIEHIHDRDMEVFGIILPGVVNWQFKFAYEPKEAIQAKNPPFVMLERRSTGGSRCCSEDKRGRRLPMRLFEFIFEFELDSSPPSWSSNNTFNCFHDLPCNPKTEATMAPNYIEGNSANIFENYNLKRESVR